MIMLVTIRNERNEPVFVNDDEYVNAMDARLRSCYDQLPDINDMSTSEVLQFMQVLYMAKMNLHLSNIEDATEATANGIWGK